MLMIAACLVVLACRALGQAPGLLWSTNVGGRLFAVDAQTNAYVIAGTNVIVINRFGQALQTNSFCPRPGIVRPAKRRLDPVKRDDRHDQADQQDDGSRFPIQAAHLVVLHKEDQRPMPEIKGVGNGADEDERRNG